MYLLKKLVVFLIGLAILVAIAGYIQTWRVMNKPNQSVFVAGQLPNPNPDGQYKGTADGYLGSWKGKKFDVANSTGINLFEENGQPVEKYKFKTYPGKGLKDKSLDVLKIDYNVEGNPFWLKMIKDEIVQTGPNKFLGKVHVNPLPGVVFTLMYFHLEK